MENKRGDWTICVSSQIGCAMRCTFCATGTMGLKRSLMADEIIDQYRFWNYFLEKKQPASNSQRQRISNIVFMGMGEPLANYNNVKQAIHTWLKYTDLGPTHITVSSVGILAQLEKILTDAEWPHVRIAISLHSANQKKREEIVPTTVPDFLKSLADWSHRYHKILGNRRHYITYEYTVLSGVNDTPELAAELATYIKKTASSKINIIPYNPVKGKPFTTSDRTRIEAFKSVLKRAGIDVTERRTMGDDIAAACGQLVVSQQT
jgi:23S rRNA (adenine2503-C2)-methyltransferase